jgi:hypothetical protein
MAQILETAVQQCEQNAKTLEVDRFQAIVYKRVMEDFLEGRERCCHCGRSLGSGRLLEVPGSGETTFEESAGP